MSANGAAGAGWRGTALAVGVPGLFVVLWSTGFVFAKLGLPSAEPATFLAVRFLIVIPLLLALALALRSTWPGVRGAGHSAVVGVLMHVVYLGGVFAAIEKGVPAGVSALIVGMQPLLTATLVGPLLGERVKPVQWAGLLLGLAGLVLVLREKLALGQGSALGYGLCVAALAGITIGTIYQKRYCARVDLVAGGVVQFTAALAVTGVLALVFETAQVAWTRDFAIAVTWLALVLSVMTVALLMWLIRRGAAAKVASLFYLTPAVAALMAWPLFGETFGLVGLAGMALTALGVALANR
ncbi:MAG: DMT family transporter [Alphaproteobacteria bacterium]